MDNRLFREEALKKIASPEQLDSMITMTSPKSWLLLIAVGVLLIFLICWGILGRIPTTVNAKGILIRETVSNIYSPVTGYVYDSDVKIGEAVHAGQILAYVVSGELYSQLAAAQAEQRELIEDKKISAVQVVRLKIKNLKDEISKESKKIISPFAGEVVEINAQDGDQIKSAQLFLRIEQFSKQPKPLDAILFVSPLEGKKIKSGMTVHVVPSYVSSEQYGYVLGKVMYVSKYPVTSWQLMKILRNESLIKLFSDNLAPIEVKVDLIASKKTLSGYQWTSSKGPPIRLESGTLCNAKIVVSEQRPISLIFPSIKGV